MGKNKKGLLAAWVLCITAVAIMTAALIRTGTDSAPPAFTPPPFEANAKKGVPDVSEGLGYSQLDATAYKVSLCGNPSMEGSSADIWLTNPADNKVWFKLRIFDREGSILGESGLLKPGEYVQKISLKEEPKPAQEIIMKIMAYEPDTYYSAGAVTLNTRMGE